MKLYCYLLFFASLYVHSTVAYSQEWHTNMDIAQSDAIDKERNILLVFQGSDWCAPCIKMERSIWLSDVFIEYASQHLVLIKADFPKRKANALPASLHASNEKLADIYNKEGAFPFVVLLDASGEVLEKSGYQSISASEYVQYLITVNK